MLESPLVSRSTPATLENHVAGTERPPHDGQYSEVLDPATGQLLARCAESSAADVADAVAAAQAARRAWGTLTPAARAERLFAFADLVEQQADALASLECLDAGKPISHVRGNELPVAVDLLRFYAGACRAQSAPAAGQFLDGHTSYVQREPFGVAGLIAAWNYPILLAVVKLAPALAAGNTVVLKPAELTPLTALQLAKLAEEVLPPGVLNVVTGGPQTGEALVRDAGVDVVSMTGSVASGALVAAAAATAPKPVALELGGNSPVLVFEDADLEAAAGTIAACGFYNAGQECTSSTRVIAHASVADELAQRLAAAAVDCKRGDTVDEATEIGPLISERQRQRVQELLEHRAPESEILTGGAPVDDDGFFFEPTVVAGVRQTDRLVREEIFGPVITVQSESDESRMAAAANDTPYGLAASLWTRDLSRALQNANELNFGTVWVNEHLVTVAEMPHGGFAASGYGKELSTLGLDQFSRVKHVMLNHG